MKLPASTDLGPEHWVTPQLPYPSGLPSESWIPANRWQPPTRERELSYDQRRAYRGVRRGLRAGLTLEQLQPKRGCKEYREAFEGWKMAHQIARLLHVSPWDALGIEVARTNGRVEWYDEKIASATSDDELIGRGALAPYVRDQRWEREHLVKTSKMLIDAGLAAHVAAQVDADGAAIAGVLLGTLEELGMPEEVIDQARSIMRRRMMALDEGENDTIEGSWTEEGKDDHRS